ncbi:MAG TPA: methyltransferase domain-containing protein, partial [Polyangiaceae bacterium]|nr:methyltransferase domain-containing protein [Polyangiaceae bacterium]
MHRLLSSWGVIIASFWLVMLGCSRNESARQETSAVAASSGSVVASAVGSIIASAVHDPVHPPIDCPLRKHGIDASHLRPFEETAQYIEFLERPDRAQWQKPDAVVAALRLHPSDVVFDLGAGSGYFSFRFAAVVPTGKVIAADTEAEMIRHIHHRSMTEGVKNVQAKLISPNTPNVDGNVDV